MRGCGSRANEPILGLIEQDTGVAGVGLQRVKERLFCILPGPVAIQPGDITALVVDAATRRTYSPSEPLPLT